MDSSGGYRALRRLRKARSRYGRGGERSPAHKDSAGRYGRPPREELYAFWRDLENLPTFMRHLESGRLMDERRSVWTAKAPRGLGMDMKLAARMMPKPVMSIKSRRRSRKARTRTAPSLWNRLRKSAADRITSRMASS